MICNNVFLVVIYNRTVESSETLSSLVKHRKLLFQTDIIIWDNSPKKELKLETIREAFSPANDVLFYQNGENTPLSKIYNYVIDNHLANYKYLTIFDHDSDLSEDYLRELFSVIRLKKEKLILPKIISNNKLVSPAKLFYFLGSHFDAINSNKLIAKNITAINSGMTIKASCFFESNFRYDEKLHFYGTDDNFMSYYCKCNQDLYVLDSEIKHTLNYFTDEAIDIKAWRFHEIMKGLLYLNKDRILLRISSVLYVFAKSLKETYRNKSLKFLILKWKS